MSLANIAQRGVQVRRRGCVLWKRTVLIHGALYWKRWPTSPEQMGQDQGGCSDECLIKTDWSRKGNEASFRKPGEASQSQGCFSGGIWKTPTLLEGQNGGVEKLQEISVKHQEPIYLIKVYRWLTNWPEVTLSWTYLPPTPQ